MNMALLVSLSVSLTIVLMLAGASTLVLARRRSQAWKTRVLQGVRTPAAEPPPRPQAAVGTSLVRLLERIGQKVMPKKEQAQPRLRTSLVLAGYRDPAAPILFWGARVVSAFALLLVWLLLPVGLPALPTPQRALLLVVLAGLGLALPNIWLRVKAQERQRKLLEAFPDALDLIVVCVEAGLGLDAAISRVGEELRLVHPELSDELRVMSLELRAGFSREEALRNLSRRTDLEEIRSLTALLIQTDRYGTSVGQALRVHANSMRKRRQFKAEELAAALPVKMLFPLVFCIFPALFVVLLAPVGIPIVNTLSGAH